MDISLGTVYAALGSCDAGKVNLVVLPFIRNSPKEYTRKQYFIGSSNFKILNIQKYITHMCIHVYIHQMEKFNKHSNPEPMYTQIFKDHKNLTGRVLIFFS